MYTKLQTVSKRWVLAGITCLCFVVQCLGQSLAGDAAVTAAVTAQTVAVTGELNSINATQSSTLAQNAVITALLNNINSYEEKMYNYMSQAQSVVTSAYTILRCLDLASDIVSELNKCRQEAMNHPQGLLVSSMITSQYSDITQEAAALVSYLTPIVKGSGSNNLLNSAERISVLNSVSSRLYNLFSAVNRLKQNIIHLRWSNLVRNISPELYYDFLDNRSAYNMAAGYIEEAERSLN